MLDFGDQVVALVLMRARGKGSGVDLEQPFAAVWTLRDGKVLRGQLFWSKSDALEAIGLRE